MIKSDTNPIIALNKAPADSDGGLTIASVYPDFPGVFLCDLTDDARICHAVSVEGGQGILCLFLRKGGEEATGSDGVTQDGVQSVTDCFLQQEAILQIAGVGPGAAGDDPLLGQLVGTGEDRHSPGFDLEADTTGPTHLRGVPQEAKAGDIGAGVDIVVSQGLSSRPVQGGHHPGDPSDLFLSELIPFDAGGVNPDSDGFGQEEAVAGEGTALAPDLVRVDRSCYRQPKLGLRIVDGMATDERGPGFLHFVGGSPQDIGQEGGIQLGDGEAHDVQGSDRSRPHGVDVTQTVGGGDLSEGIRVIHHRSEEVHRLDQSGLIIDPDYAGIVGLRQAHQHFRVFLVTG